MDADKKHEIQQAIAQVIEGGALGEDVPLGGDVDGETPFTPERIIAIAHDIAENLSMVSGFEVSSEEVLAVWVLEAR